MTQYSVVYAFDNKKQCKKFINEVIKIGVEYTLKKKHRNKNMCESLIEFYKFLGIDKIKYEVECKITDEQDDEKLDAAHCRIMEES